MPPISQNQFNQIPIKGELDQKFNPNTVPARVDSTTAGGLIPGQAVKRVASGIGGGTLPLVVECAADSDEVFGFINYNLKDTTYGSGDVVGISLVNGGNVMYMEASAAIAVNAVVAIVITGTKVKTSTGGSRDVGRAYDQATAAGDLIRVIMLPKTTTTA